MGLLDVYYNNSMDIKMKRCMLHWRQNRVQNDPTSSYSSYVHIELQSVFFLLCTLCNYKLHNNTKPFNPDDYNKKLIGSLTS